MEINSNTRIKVLLDVERDKVIESLILMNKNFAKLRNPVLRRLLANRVTIAQACSIAKCEVDEFMKCMEKIGFVIAKTSAGPIIEKEPSVLLDRPAKVVTLDVRPYLEKNTDPLKEILKLAKQIHTGERLKIINSFEPIPLISLLAEKGFTHLTEVLAPDMVVTWFEKAKDPQLVEAYGDLQEIKPALFEDVLSNFAADKIRYLDVRALEMPQPMLQILAGTTTLAPDELLYVHHKKLPVYLLPELSKAGFRYAVKNLSPTGLDMLIYKS